MILPLIAVGVGIGLGALGAGIMASGAKENSDQAMARRMYRDMAQGKGPSYATRLIQNQMNTIQQQNNALAQSVNPSNPNASARTAMMSSDATVRNLTGQAAAIRAQEQQAAIAGLHAAGSAKQQIDQQRAAAWGSMFSSAGGVLTSLGAGGMGGGGVAGAASALGQAGNAAPGQGTGSNVGTGAGLYYTQAPLQAPAQPMGAMQSGGNVGGAYMGATSRVPFAYSAPQDIPAPAAPRYQPQYMDMADPDSFYSRGFRR